MRSVPKVDYLTLRHGFIMYEFGIKSCFHEHVEDIVIRISMGVLIQILCSYVTLPLYALVTQMGSSMKPTIFNERVATALRNWHHTAKKNIKQNNNGSVSGTPLSSRPTTRPPFTSCATIAVKWTVSILLQEDLTLVLNIGRQSLPHPLITPSRAHRHTAARNSLN